jgi:hypothetical protein
MHVSYFGIVVEDRPTLFIEIIQRHNHQGFGAGNFKGNNQIPVLVKKDAKFKPYSQLSSSRLKPSKLFEETFKKQKKDVYVFIYVLTKKKI